MNITLDSKKISYEIVIENGALDNLNKWLNLDRKVVVVTDDGVPASYAQRVAAQCKSATIVTFPQGEKSKSPQTFLYVLSEILKADLTRKDCVVAVGGGVVGDLSGFAASCYMRGIDFYNVPTTLLSQIDSSVGGKTAVDFEGVKNVVGAFWQPKGVIVDPLTLETLDSRQLYAGLAEAIKMASTSDAELLELIKNSDDLKSDLPEIIRRSLMIKRDVVEQDPEEGGLRRVLNFGHTIGHAIESASDGKLLHGECVALGMLPMCDNELREELTYILKKYHLPVTFDGNVDDLLPIMLHDKKKQSNVIKAVYVEKAGSFKFVDMTAQELIEKAKVLSASN